MAQTESSLLPFPDPSQPQTRRPTDRTFCALMKSAPSCSDRGRINKPQLAKGSHSELACCTPLKQPGPQPLS